MHDKSMKALMAKKKDQGKMSPEHKAAKLSVLKDLRDQAMDSMSSGLGKGKKDDHSAMKELAGASEGAQKACAECGKMGCFKHKSDVDEVAKEGYSETEAKDAEAYEGDSAEHEAGETSAEEVAEHTEAFAGRETPAEEEAEEMTNYENMTPEQIDAKIAMLKGLKMKKQGKPQA